MSNATHSVDFSSYNMFLEAEIGAFDKLPKFARERIANSPFTISSKTILNLWNALQNESMVIKAIEQIEQQMRDGVI